jgi:hypothetical protein
MGSLDLPRPGLPRRITETERGHIIALARSAPPGRLHQGGEGLLAPEQPQAPAPWTLDPRTEAAQAAGIRVGRSPDPPHLARRTGALAVDPLACDQHRPRLRPKRAAVIARYAIDPAYRLRWSAWRRRRQARARACHYRRHANGP